MKKKKSEKKLNFCLLPVPKVTNRLTLTHTTDSTFRVPQLSIKLESLMKEKKMAATEIQSAVEQFRTNSTTTLTALLGKNEKCQLEEIFFYRPFALPLSDVQSFH